MKISAHGFAQALSLCFTRILRFARFARALVLPGIKSVTKESLKIRLACIDTGISGCDRINHIFRQEGGFRLYLS